MASSRALVGRKSSKCQEWLAPTGVASPLVEGAAYQLTAAGDLFVFTPTTGRFVGADTAVVTAFDAADRSTWTTQPCGTGLQIEALGECAIITDGDASVDGMAAGTPWEGDYYTMPLLAGPESQRDWLQSLAGTSTTPGGGDETSLTIPGAATLVPYVTTADGTDTTGVTGPTSSVDGDGQVVILDPIYSFGKPSGAFSATFERFRGQQFDAVKIFDDGTVDGRVVDFGYGDGIAADPDNIILDLSGKFGADGSVKLQWWIFDAHVGFKTVYANEQNGVLFSTTEQNTLVVDVYRINGELYGKLPVAFDYQGAGELPAGTYVPLQDGQATWCCGCDTEAAAETNAHLASIDTSNAAIQAELEKPVRIDRCGIITDGDASVDGLTATTILGGTAYEAPTGPQNNTMDWILSGWSAEAFPIQNPPTAPLTPFGGSTPITTATPGTIYVGSIGQVDEFDPIYIYGKPGSHPLSFFAASNSHIEAYQDVETGTVYDIPFGADQTRQITATIADNSVGSVKLWAYDVFNSYDRPYIANSGGLLVSTTPQTATVVDLYRDSTGNLFYVENDEFVAYPHPESTTWCCGCESETLSSTLFNRRLLATESVTIPAGAWSYAVTPESAATITVGGVEFVTGVGDLFDGGGRSQLSSQIEVSVAGGQAQVKWETRV